MFCKRRVTHNCVDQHGKGLISKRNNNKYKSRVRQSEVGRLQRLN
jgi:hypothetical protein